MGYNTVILFLNDAAHLLPEDKEFPQKLHDAILRVSGHGDHKATDVSVGNHVNAVRVLGSAHADWAKIWSIGGNTGELLGTGSSYNSEHVLLRRLAEQHGFKLSRKGVFKVYSDSKSQCRDCSRNHQYGSCYDCQGPLTESGACAKACGGRR